MHLQIVTNNPKVPACYDNIIFVQGSYEDVLLKTRDYVHLGHNLVSHPLGASIRMFFSPYRSIVIGQHSPVNSNLSIEIIENSIANYKKHMTTRTPDTANAEDYATIDLELLQSALSEYERVYY